MPTATPPLDFDDESPPYEKWPEEPPRHYEWFHVYLMMGPARSLLGAYKKFYAKSQNVSKSLNVSPSWKEAARKWDWKGRAGAWDEEKRREREIEVDAVRREVFGDLVLSAKELLAATKRMNAFPLIETRTDTATGTTIVMPAKWSRETIHKNLSAASKAYLTAFSLEDTRQDREIDAESQEDAIAGAIETLRALGFTVIEPDEQDEPEDEDSDED